MGLGECGPLPDCDLCQKLYTLHKESPPCGTCPRGLAEPLNAHNATPWQLWVRANAYGRNGFNGRLDLIAITAYARAIGASRDELEEALKLEDHLWPMIKGDDK